MPTESNAISFHREDRYNVIKYTDLDKLSHAERRAVSGFLRRIHESVLREGAPARSFLVIESDWPEYEPVWQMIERRMTGQPEVSAAEELDAVLHWRDKHAVAIKERDALQQRLTAADERADQQSWALLEVEAACDLAMSAMDDDERGTNFVKIVAAIKAKALPKRSDELVAQHAAIDFFDDALNPAEAGGDEY